VDDSTKFGWIDAPGFRAELVKVPPVRRGRPRIHIFGRIGLDYGGGGKDTENDAVSDAAWVDHGGDRVWIQHFRDWLILM
jgi:hypothetical protein